MPKVPFIQGLHRSRMWWCNKRVTGLNGDTHNTVIQDTTLQLHNGGWEGEGKERGRGTRRGKGEGGRELENKPLDTSWTIVAMSWVWDYWQQSVVAYMLLHALYFLRFFFMLIKHFLYHNLVCFFPLFLSFSLSNSFFFPIISILLYLCSYFTAYSTACAITYECNPSTS